MANSLETSEKLGIIPDFFHDILAYIVPGYTAIILFLANHIVIGVEPFFNLPESGIKEISVSMIVAYILGRFFEQFGYFTVHKHPLRINWEKFPSVSIESTGNPKWGLIYDANDDSYTPEFKQNLRSKISYWLRKQNGDELLKRCEAEKKDDYFNLIQFYLRARFPTVAIYEKKQNATIILCRSLSIIGATNIVAYTATLFLKCGFDIEKNLTAAVFLFGCLMFSAVMYSRYLQDRKYHAMYIFETFIATKKLLKRTKNSDGGDSEKPNKQSKPNKP